ncbi:MAG: YdcF family protein [Anaerolineae bacterium]|nr:YdcF family protein [Anaerolineae bacterium]
MNETQGKKNKRRSCVTWLGGTVGLIILIVALPFLVELGLWGLGGVLIVADPPAEVDAIIVLSGGSDLSRVEEAGRLYEDKLAEWIILTRVNEQPVEAKENDLIITKKDLLFEYGIPNDKILATGEVATSTKEEAELTLRLMQERGLTSAMVVTDPFHSLRTRLIFQDVFRGSGVKTLVRPVRGHWYRSATWWSTPEGRQATVSEYLKLLAYLLGQQTGVIE